MDRGLPVDFWFCTPDQAFQENRRLVESEREGQIFAESIDTQYGYLTPYLREWASNPLLRLIVIDYPILEKLPLQGLCVDLVELFQESNIPVSWLMLESGNPSTEPPTKEFLLKALIFQIIQLPQFPQEVNFIAPSYDNDDEVSLLEFLTSAIAKIENIVIVIDSSLLRCARPSYGDVIVHSWISTLLGISRCEHWRSDKGIYPPGGGVKVVFAAYDCEPLQLQPTQPDYEGHWLYVDTTKSITCPPPRPSQLRGRLTRIRQLGRVVRAYIDSIEERSSKKISEQPLARLYPDGADVPSFEPIELTAHVESPTSSNSKQPSAPPSREKVAESIVTIIQNYSTFDGIRPPIVPTSATQAPRSQLSATFSQRSEAQPATPQPSSSRTECISHKAVASVSRFELFDNQEPLGDAANKADMWFECLREDVVLDLPDNSVEDRIRIAVLDTGISVDDDFIHMDENLNRITYRSFVTGDPNPTEASDLDGHGTHVAGLLLRVARNANIYVAKISKKDGLRDPQEIATQAIRYAVDEWDVHIISMSFGFDRHTLGMSCITDEIRYATFMKTVLFAAAHNDGGRKEIAYPANHSDVICINSTNGDGTPSSFNPSPKKGKNFSTLGEGVPLHSDITNRKSGTSYATPIAAGIAAVVMDYMVRKSKSWSEERRSVVELIKTRDGIVAVFDKHFSDKRSDFKYLFPWKFFRRGAIGLDMVLLNTLQSI